MVVHLKGFGFIKVFKIVVTENHIEYWATNDLQMNELSRLKLAQWSWMIETYHRGIKQFCGIERCQAGSATAQRNPYDNEGNKNMSGVGFITGTTTSTQEGQKKD